jgi:hypothetical protein
MQYKVEKLFYNVDLKVSNWFGMFTIVLVVLIL